MSTNTRLTLAGLAFIGCCNLAGCGLGWAAARACIWWNDRA